MEIERKFLNWLADDRYCWLKKYQVEIHAKTFNMSDLYNYSNLMSNEDAVRYFQQYHLLSFKFICITRSGGQYWWQKKKKIKLKLFSSTMSDLHFFSNLMSNKYTVMIFSTKSFPIFQNCLHNEKYRKWLSSHGNNRKAWQCILTLSMNYTACLYFELLLIF